MISGSYVDVLGLKTYFEEAGQGPVVILLHTAGRDGRQWHGVMEELASRFRLIAPDLPGHGRSWPLGESGCLDDIEAIGAWISDFANAVGVERYAFCGCSMGGNLALLMPTIDARVVATVALQGADRTPTISQSSLDMMCDPRVSLPHANMDFTMSLVGAAADPAGRDFIRWGVRSINAPAQHGDLTAYSHGDIRDRMALVTVPVTLVHGTEDWVVTRQMVDAAASRLTHAARVEVISLPQIGHFPHVEAPEQVARLIEQALEVL